jgi:hypothetical protein
MLRLAGGLRQLRPPGRAGRQIPAAAVFLPPAHYMPEEAFNTWGWRIPFLLSFVIIAGYVSRRKVDETWHSPKKVSTARSKAPIIQVAE